jgi:hypothetical protein
MVTIADNINLLLCIRYEEFGPSHFLQFSISLGNRANQNAYPFHSYLEKNNDAKTSYY